MKKDSRIRANINEFLYIDFIYIDGKILVIRDRGIPKRSYKFVDRGNKFVLVCCDKELGELDKDTGLYEGYKTYITTNEIRNFNLDRHFKGKHPAFKKNRRHFNKKKGKEVPYPIELHTHFMEVLSEEEFLDVLKGLDKIPLRKNGEIAFCDVAKVINGLELIYKESDEKNAKIIEYEDLKWVPIKVALQKPDIFEQLRIPVGKQNKFLEIHKALMKRNGLLNLLSYKNALKKRIPSATSPEKFELLQRKAKYSIYYKLLIKSLKVLEAQGIKYVEFSFSNISTLQSLITLIRDNKPQVGNIKFKFLLSAHRNKDKVGFRKSMKKLSAILDQFPEIVGFDLMGQEQEIDMNDQERELNVNGDPTCKNLYGQLELVVRQLLATSAHIPTLRLHAGEFYYDKEDSKNNNPYFILLLLERIENLLKEEKNDPNFKLADHINIRIGHGLHFQDIPEYYKLLKHFNVIVEICESSNFALGNIADLAQIPYDKYIKNKIPFVIGTDGGGFYLTTLKGEARNAAYHGIKEVMKRIKKARTTAPREIHDPNAFITDDVFGLDMKKTVDQYLNEHNDLRFFFSQYGIAENKNTYLMEFLSSININGQVVLKEFVKVQAYYHDLVINETYYTSEEEAIIYNNFRQIQSLINKKEYVGAAILLVSLQAVMGMNICLDKVVVLMKMLDLDFNKCLTTKAIKKSAEIKTIYNDNDDIKLSKIKKITDSEYSMIDYIFDTENYNDDIYINVLEEYIYSDNYRLDNPKKKFFNNDITESQKVISEYRRVFEKIKSMADKNDNLNTKLNISKEEALILLQKLDMIREYIEQGEIVKSAVAIVCLQEYLGMDVRLETAQLYKRAMHYTLDDFFLSDQINFEKRGGKKR